MTCGSCRFLQSDRLPNEKESCIAKGKLISSKSCHSHRPDVLELARSGKRVISDLERLSHIVGNMNRKQAETLAAVLLRIPSMKKLGFRFYQKVYVRIQGDTRHNYLSNFASGFIVDADKEYIRVVGESGTSFSLMNDVESSSFYTVERFREIRRQMLADRNYVDPNVKVYVPSVSSGKIPDLDLADLTGSIDTIKKGKRKITRVKDDLVSFYSKLQRGLLPKETRRRGGDESVSF